MRQTAAKTSGRGLDGPEASGPKPNRTIRSGTEPESGPQGLGPKPPEDQSAAGSAANRVGLAHL